MEPSTMVLWGVIGLFSSLVVICISGLFERQLAEIIGTFFMLFLRPFQLIESGLASFWRGVGNFYREQFTVDGNLDYQAIFFQFIGSILYTLFFAAFTLSEFHLLALSLVAIGVDQGHYRAPFGAGNLTAISIISSFLFFGAVIADLKGVTNTAPWIKTLKKKWQNYLLYLTLFSLGLSLFITVTMGLFRGKVIAQDSLLQPYSGQSQPFHSNPQGLSSGIPGFPTVYTDDSAEGFYYWIPIIANTCVPVIIGIGGLLASWGIVSFIKFFMLLMGFIILSPLGFLLITARLMMNIVDRIYQLVEAVFRFLGSMGRKLLALFGWTPSAQASDRTEDTHPDAGTSGDPHSCGDDKTNQDSSPEDTINPSKESWNPYR